MKPAAFPKNEIERIMALADLNPDYLNLQETLKDLAKLAARIAGSPISLINLIDNYTVWTVSSYGFDVVQTPREESICQYTILEQEQYAIDDLTEHPNFQNEDFVTGDLHFRSYHGIPLKENEYNLGALCVIAKKSNTLSAEKVEMLKIIGGEIVNRLKTLQYIESLKGTITEVKHTQNKVVHDIRGPIAGIIGLAEIIKDQGKAGSLDEVLEFIGMIHKGGKSILELADDILTDAKATEKKARSGAMTLDIFKQRLEQLYAPQAKSKEITFNVGIVTADKDFEFPQNKLMQIAGNLISNAIKFTPRSGTVSVTLDAQHSEKDIKLNIIVKDSGKGIDSGQIATLLADNTESTDGTDGEKGYGFGLALVKHLGKGWMAA